MKTAVVLLSLALVFLAVLEQSAAYPGEVEVKGKKTKSASDIESASSKENEGIVKVGDVTYQTGSKNDEFSKDIDTAEASQNEQTVYDDNGNLKKIRSKSSKTTSEDFDAESSSSYYKIDS